MSSLTTAINAANILINDNDELHQRLIRFYAALDEQPPSISDTSRNALQLETARAALKLVHRVQLLLDTIPDDPQPGPEIGTRDLTVLRTLLTLIFQWGINPLLARLTPLWQTKTPPNASLTDLSALSLLLFSLMSTLFPSWRACTTPSDPHYNIHPSQTHTRSSQSFHRHCVAAKVIMPRGYSLRRPGGVRALFAAVFGEQEGSDDPVLEKYERTAGILMAVPAGVKPEEYFGIVIPRLMELLSNDVPATYRRAASFSISRMLHPEFVYGPLVSSLVSPIIHYPLLRDSKVVSFEGNSEGPSPATVLSILTTLLLNTDPSPVFITHVLSPVVTALYALIFHLDTMKATDPVLRESVQGLLATWGRVVEMQDGVNTLWSVIRGKRIHWKVDISGNIKHGTPERPAKLALLTPEDNKGRNIMEENFLDLYPDPVHFVQYVKSIERQDIASELFVRLLEVYHSVDTEPDTEPSGCRLIVSSDYRPDADAALRRVFYHQHPSQARTYFILRKARPRILCDPSSPSTLNKPRTSSGLGLEDLRIVDDADESGHCDSDDELEELGNDQGEDSMTATAINLLLAILEANPELSARNAPVLNDIFSLLEPFSKDTSDSIKGLARETRMVMTARLASSSTSWSAPQRKDDDPQEIYQKALKLLQDPILPVRAHGLLLLRQLVSSRPLTSASTTDAALVPAIMSIFMQSVQDDDSYIFLNAVQGLSAMVDTFGKDVLRNLLETYTHNLSATSVGTFSKQDVDAKVRVGEALGQVIRRCGSALGLYADIIVPRLISVFRSSYAPTVLRTSAVSLLTQCVKTSMVSVIGYVDDLATSMIDFLQIEMVSAARPAPPKNGDGEKPIDKAEGHKQVEVLDSKPTTVDPKLPPLRRAALHFWTTLLQQLTLAMYDGATMEKLPLGFLRRAKVTLGYVSSTDEDGIVREMAKEAREAVDQLNKAMLGI
ncbi:hypothetical protein JVU11DRAFT_1873 [Chiua virens]|nr:hypothetical protein JVU11DRAFT_1873 [Chiua virens]